MKYNSEYKAEALAALKGNWAPAVIATIVYMVVAAICGVTNFPFLSKVASSNLAWIEGATWIVIILVLYPLSVGYSNACRFLYEKQDTEVTKNMFDIPLNAYLRCVWGMLWMMIKIFLWTLLLIVPGIVKAFSYAMTPFILVDHPELSVNEAIHKSSRMMQGHRFDLFFLYLSFIGWFLLALLTCGIGFLWLQPYVECAVASFYNDLKAANGEYVSDGGIIHDAQIVSE